ncbi:histidine kinase, partial [Streptomyces arenae]|nr:histidine kinase [Streptomyces arenae]
MPEGADAPLPSMPLLEAVLAVGTDLELRATLQHIVDSAARLTGARHGTLTTHGHSPGPEGPGELFVAGGPAGRDTEALGNGNRHGAGAGNGTGNGSGTGNG